ncbi:MAG: cell division protein [Anaerolineaceae bacterium]|nr:cell division protein [Anaerolineaceae bacterium]
MPENDELLNILREAAQASPQNVALQKQFADLLLEAEAYAEAETVYRHILSLEPENQAVKFALSQSFYHQGKEAVALVILERLLVMPKAKGEWHLLAAQAYWRTEQPEQAREAYRQAVQRDASLVDVAFATEMGVVPLVEGDTAVQPKDGEEETAVLLPVDPPEPPPHSEIEQAKISFKDVGGMEKLKEEIRLKIIHPLQKPEIYQAYGKKIGGGILMYGPPGCGKTHLARATAGEVNAAFLSVGLHDVLNMYLGQSEQNLHGLFELARRYTPCVLFFDEVDALGANRSDMRRSAGRQLINQFLAELDGVEQSNEGVLVLAATNAPWHLDPAFRRPGRFDRVIFVPPPDTLARHAILQLMLQGKPTDGIQFEQLAKKTVGFSGADLKGMVDTAVELKLQEALQKGVPAPITNKELMVAAKKMKPSTTEWFNSARNYALYANQGGLYDDVLDYVKTSETRSLGAKLTFWRDE